MRCPDCGKEMDTDEQYYEEKDDMICMHSCECGTVFEGVLERTYIYEVDAK